VWSVEEVKQATWKHELSLTDPFTAIGYQLSAMVVGTLRGWDLSPLQPPLVGYANLCGSLLHR